MNDVTPCFASYYLDAQVFLNLIINAQVVVLLPLLASPFSVVSLITICMFIYDVCSCHPFLFFS